MEYTGSGLGDYREGTLSVRTPGGHVGVYLSYVSHKIYDGKPKLDGLPATFGQENECKTLELKCEDSILKLQVILPTECTSYIRAISWRRLSCHSLTACVS